MTKAFNRGLLSNEEFEKEIKDLGVKLNNYINGIGKNQNKKTMNDLITTNDSMTKNYI